LLEAKADPNKGDKKRRDSPPYHLRAKLLLEAKADPNKENKYGNTPHYRAA
jgi:ankyrin repeat protein